MNLHTLREETRAEHEAVESMLPLTGPDLTRARYVEILQCYYRVVQGWEAWATDHVPPRLAALVHQRRRAALLLRDLRFFGLHVPSGFEGAVLDMLGAQLAGVERHAAEYEAVFLGAMYVMEGSTLGGQYIARHVEEVLGLAAGQGDAYFRGYGEETGSMWNAFRQVLGAVPDEYAPAVISAAKAVFAYVGETMHSCSGLPGAETASILSGRAAS